MAFEPLADSSRCQRVIILGLTPSSRPIWAWVTPGFWALKIEFQSELEFATELGGLASDAVVEGYAHQRHQAASTGAWLQTIGVGMDDLRANLKKKLVE